ncbi:MAG TPA: alpha/beta fold hydrolase [Actinomycetota bacterium]|jgi:pimeloyl-ACP methyl ester carboxylesterase
MPSVELDDLSIAYECAGTGPALVLLHGGLSDHREWRRQLDGLSDSFTVVAWDAPGCGGSSDPPASFRMPDYADRLAAFIEALGMDSPHVLGLSWGSTLALELYRRRPDLPQSLVLTAAYAGWAGSLPPEEVARRLETILADLEAPSPEDFARRWVPSLFTHRAALDVVEGYVAVMADLHPEGVRPMLHAMAEADLRDVLPAIAVPTLLLYGAEDERSPLPVARAMHDAIPGSTMVVLPEVGHMSNLETPERFNAAVREFLTQHGPGAGRSSASRSAGGG